MTKTFDNFLEQYHSSGSQKADGYNKSHFYGLTAKEKEKAFELLINESIAPGVADWLFYLDKERAENLLKNEINHSNKDSMSGIHRLYLALYRNTHDKRYQNLLIDGFFSYSELDKCEALLAIKSTGPDSNRILELYKKIIFSSNNSKVITSAADLFLRHIKQPCESENDRKEFYSIRKMLESDDLKTKTTGLNIATSRKA